MRCIVDEDLPRRTVELLRQSGHDAIFVKDIELKGAADQQIAAYAQEQSRTIVTCDLGFADIRNYPPEKFFGIIVLRRRGNINTEHILGLLSQLNRHESILKDLKGKLLILDKEQIRIRK